MGNILTPSHTHTLTHSLTLTRTHSLTLALSQSHTPRNSSQKGRLRLAIALVSATCAMCVPGPSHSRTRTISHSHTVALANFDSLIFTLSISHNLTLSQSVCVVGPHNADIGFLLNVGIKLSRPRPGSVSRYKVAPRRYQCRAQDLYELVRVYRSFPRVECG